MTESQQTVLRPTFATPEKRPTFPVVPPIKADKRTIVVLGVERGGTSMVAAVVRALGVNMGERAGLNHEDPRFLSDDEGRLAELIKERNEKLDVWGFKAPKAALSLDFFHKHLRNPHYIIVYRNIASVADSWFQRGAGDHLGAIERTMNYYNRCFDFMNEVRPPTLVVNYERATREKDQFVRDVAEFCGAMSDQKHLAKAIGMITGEGQGYVNLPEYYFFVEPLKTATVRLSEDYRIVHTDNVHELSENGKSYIQFENQKKKILLHSESGNLPKRFFIKFDVEAPSSLDLDENPFRFYFNFTDEYFPGHATRPFLVRGRNIIHIETNGKAKNLAIGAFRPGIEAAFKNIRLYSEAQGEIAPQDRPNGPVPRTPSFSRRVARRIRRWLKR